MKSLVQGLQVKWQNQGPFHVTVLCFFQKQLGRLNANRRGFFPLQHQGHVCPSGQERRDTVETTLDQEGCWYLNGLCYQGEKWRLLVNVNGDILLKDSEVQEKNVFRTKRVFVFIFRNISGCNSLRVVPLKCVKLLAV